jgi:hypothetical protein
MERILLRVFGLLPTLPFCGGFVFAAIALSWTRSAITQCGKLMMLCGRIWEAT